MKKITTLALALGACARRSRATAVGASSRSASPGRSPARTPPSARSSRTARSRPSTTSTPPAACMGQQITLEFGDDVSDPKQGVSVANKFVGDGVKFVVGHFNSGVTMPASEVYMENGILMITPAATNPSHRARPVERVPHLRSRRPAGRGCRRLHRQALQGQEGRRRARQDHLRPGPRRRDQEGDERRRREGGAV